MDSITHIRVLAFAVCMAFSAVTFVVYGIDKHAARNGRSRVAERVLHLLAAFGGWPGAWVAQRVFRHKTRKQPFRRIFWATLIPPLGALLLVAYLSLR